MKESFIIPYPKTAAGRKQWNKLYGLNAYWAGKHWAKRKEDADYWHRLVRYEMQRQNVRKAPFEKPVKITYLFNDNLDATNHAAMVKMIEDAMKGRIIREDSRRYVKGFSCWFHSGDHIKVIVEELE